MEDPQNDLYAGNLFWLLEAFKTEYKEIKFLKEEDKNKCKENDPFPENLEIPERLGGLSFYDTVIFNEGKGDSFYFVENKKLYEFYSINKSQVIHKMIQKYEERNPLTEEEKQNLTIQKYSKYQHIPSGEAKFSDSTEKWLYEKRKNAEKNKKSKGKKEEVKEVKEKVKPYDPEEQFRIKVKANMRITLKNKEVKWINNKEIKNLLFTFPYASNTRIVRFFPTYINKENFKLKYFEYNSELGKKFSSGLEEDVKANDTPTKEISEEEETLLNKTIDDIKQIFYSKYLLSLKFIKLSYFEFKGTFYLEDVQKLIFEKLENKHIKLDSEAYYFQYLRQHKGYCELDKIRQAKVMKEIPVLYDAMVQKFEQQFNAIVDAEYMTWPKRDMRSNEDFKKLNPDCPYPLHELLEEHIDLRTFVTEATHNLWNMGDCEEKKNK